MSNSIAVLGLGYSFDRLEKWLAASSKHHLVYLGEDLQQFLNTKNGKKIQSHPQVTVAILGEDNWKKLAKLTNDFQFLSDPALESRVQTVYPWLLQQVYAIQSYLSDLWLYKEQANFYLHLAKVNEYQSSKELKMPFPITLCGAGPSLERHLERLMKKNRVLIASGTAMNILNDFGIDVDLGVAFDAKLSGARRLQSNSAFKTPFLVDLDSTREGEKYLSGRKILTKQANLAEWKERLLKKLGISDQILAIGPSISSTHYALEIAIRSGATSVEMLGVDLAYVEGRHYAGKKTWFTDQDQELPLERRKDLIQIPGKGAVSRTFYMEAILYDQLEKELSHSFEEKEGHLTLETLPYFEVPCETIGQTLLEWRGEIQKSGQALIKGYQERLDLLGEKNPELCRSIIEWHLKAIDEALLELNQPINRSIKAQIPKKNGKLDGMVELFYDTGQLKSEIAYCEGKRHGIYRFYSQEGKLLEEGTYEKGVPMDLTEWDRKGEIVKEIKHGSLNEGPALKNSIEELLKEL